MTNDYVHKNPQYLTEIFARYCNMFLLMVAITRKLKLFKKVGGSNSEIRSDEKSRDNEYLAKES
jgi:hypothetical protein